VVSSSLTSKYLKNAGKACQGQAVAYLDSLSLEKKKSFSTLISWSIYPWQAFPVSSNIGE
jgi:hypothetical protein